MADKNNSAKSFVTGGKVPADGDVAVYSEALSGYVAKTPLEIILENVAGTPSTGDVIAYASDGTLEWITP